MFIGSGPKVADSNEAYFEDYLKVTLTAHLINILLSYIAQIIDVMHKMQSIESSSRLYLSRTNIRRQNPILVRPDIKFQSQDVQGDDDRLRHVGHLLAPVVQVPELEPDLVRVNT